VRLDLPIQQGLRDNFVKTSYVVSLNPDIKNIFGSFVINKRNITGMFTNIYDEISSKKVLQEQKSMIIVKAKQIKMKISK